VAAKHWPDPDDILPEYDFSRARLNKYARRISENLFQESGVLPLTDSQREELDRRLDEVDRDGSSGIPWESDSRIISWNIGMAAIDISTLTVEQRLELLDEIWESLYETPQGIPLTEAQREELDRRIEEFDNEGLPGAPRAGAPLDEALDRIRTHHE
jgi:putative addiction module component (TIGR02574 family)